MPHGRSMSRGTSSMRSSSPRLAQKPSPSPSPSPQVRSLQRYSDALKGLFDPKLSSIELLALEPRGARRFVAHWRLRGALKLPCAVGS